MLYGKHDLQQPDRAICMRKPPVQDQVPAVAAEEAPRQRPLTPEAARALAEASERRRAAGRDAGAQSVEVGGRDGPDPVRYGDWEKGGIASDF
jgi:hypothetical protein